MSADALGRLARHNAKATLRTTLAPPLAALAPAAAARALAAAARGGGGGAGDAGSGVGGGGGGGMSLPLLHATLRELAEEIARRSVYIDTLRLSAIVVHLEV